MGLAKKGDQRGLYCATTNRLGELWRFCRQFFAPGLILRLESQCIWRCQLRICELFTQIKRINGWALALACPGSSPLVEVTRVSLLDRAGAGDSAAWDRLVLIYKPLIERWLGGCNVPKQEAEDLAQDVLLVVFKELPRFQHQGRLGSFRAWLRQIVVNQARKYWRTGRCRVAANGISFLEVLDQLENPESDLAHAWDAEHDRQIYHRLLTVLEENFEASTVQAFRLMTQEGLSGPEVSARTGMSLAAVYGARARVLKRLRQEADGLLD
jgi:RNA polymerase sigma-70 factor, ECF subfamily